MVIWLLLLVLFAVPSAEAAVLRGTLYDMSLDKAHDVRVDISTVPQQRYLSKDGSYSFKVAPGNYTIKAEQYKDEVIVAHATEQVAIMDSNDYQLDIVMFPVVESQDELLGDAIFDTGNILLERSTPWWAWVMGAGLMVVAGVSGYLYFTRQKKPDVILSSTVVRELDKMTLAKALNVKTEATDAAETQNNQLQANHLTNPLANPQTAIHQIAQDIKQQAADSKSQATDQKNPASSPNDDLQSIISFIEKEGGRTTQKELRKHFPYSEAKISLMLAELEHKATLEKIKKGRGNIIILKAPLSQQPPSSAQ